MIDWANRWMYLRSFKDLTRLIDSLFIRSFWCASILALFLPSFFCLPNWKSISSLLHSVSFLIALPLLLFDVFSLANRRFIYIYVVIGCSLVTHTHTKRSPFFHLLLSYQHTAAAVASMLKDAVELVLSSPLSLIDSQVYRVWRTLLVVV